MAFIPKDAKWYLAELVEALTVEGDPTLTIHINMILVRAGDPEEAYQSALQLGSEYQTSYQNPGGRTVTIRFAGIHTLNVIHDELEHGAELSYRRIHSTDPATASTLARPKAELGVFAARRPNTGPDYSSKSALEDAARLLDSSTKPA
ncbi:MAG: DUF4288 domain-containing protein [Bryobacterales bacterium]|nr:DUF4288 domain-containing protein [Bryobacterales bacterium]